MYPFFLHWSFELRASWLGRCSNHLNHEIYPVLCIYLASWGISWWTHLWNRVCLCVLYFTVFCIDNYVIYKYRKFIFSFPTFHSLLLFFCIALAGPFSALLNMSDREKYPCLVPNLRGKYFALYYQVGWHLLGFVNAV
jgi:hypothetical protein